LKKGRKKSRPPRPESDPLALSGPTATLLPPSPLHPQRPARGPASQTGCSAANERVCSQPACRCGVPSWRQIGPSPSAQSPLASLPQPVHLARRVLGKACWERGRATWSGLAGFCGSSMLALAGSPKRQRQRRAAHASASNDLVSPDGGRNSPSSRAVMGPNSLPGLKANRRPGGPWPVLGALPAGGGSR